MFAKYKMSVRKLTNEFIDELKNSSIEKLQYLLIHTMIELEFLNSARQMIINELRIYLLTIEFNKLNETQKKYQKKKVTIISDPKVVNPKSSGLKQPTKLKRRNSETKIKPQKYFSPGRLNKIKQYKKTPQSISKKVFITSLSKTNKPNNDTDKTNQSDERKLISPSPSKYSLPNNIGEFNTNMDIISYFDSNHHPYTEPKMIEIKKINLEIDVNEALIHIIHQVCDERNISHVESTYTGNMTKLLIKMMTG